MTPQELQAKVGETIGTSEWVEVTQERINQFADATGDHQFIHVNEEAAKMTPFGGTIAHGFLTLSLIPMMRAKSDCPRPEGVKMGVNYGGNKVRKLEYLLADALGLSAVHINRTLQQLRRAGLVDYRTGRAILPDLQGLALAAGLSIADDLADAPPSRD